MNAAPANVTYTCPSCGTSGLSAAELRDEEVAGPWTEIPEADLDECLPAEWRGRHMVGSGGVRAVTVTRRCLWCAGSN